jgi:hypothetical protein
MFKMGVRIIYNVEKSTSNWRGVLQTGEEYFKLERSTSYLKYSFPECGEEDLPILFEKGRSAFPLDKSILLIFKKCKKRRKKSETPYYMKGIKCDTVWKRLGQESSLAPLGQHLTHSCPLTPLNLLKVPTEIP